MYFLFNKAMDYRRGHGYNTEFDDTGLWVKDCRCGEPGVFVSRILDTGQSGTQWHKMTARTEIGGNQAVYVRFYGSDEEGTAVRVRDILTARLFQGWSETSSKPEEERSCFLMEARNPKDILLWEFSCRYLWVVLILWGNKETGPKVKELALHFPKHSVLSYLPEVYQTEDNSFLERFLAVFQTIYEELEQRIRQSPAQLDLMSAKGEYLRSLASWLDVEDQSLWKEERLRSYLKAGAGVYERRGTAKGLTELVQAFIGKEAFIREDDTGTAPDVCTLLVPCEAVRSNEEYQILLQIIEEGKPADLAIKLVLLRPWVRLDSNAYLGVNTRISAYGEAALDGYSMLSMVTAGGGK